MKKVHFYILHFYKIIDFLMRIRSIKKLQLKYYNIIYNILYIIL